MQIHIYFLTILALAYASEERYFSLTLISQGSVTPKYPVPTMNWSNWDEPGPNYLTGMGLREQYLLGREFHSRYYKNQLIDFDYVADQVLVHTASSNCNIMSGQSFLRGFLGVNPEVLSQKELNRVKLTMHIDPHFKNIVKNIAIPGNIHTFSLSSSNPYNEDPTSVEYCQRKGNNLDELENNDEAKKIKKEYDENFKKMLEKHYKISTISFGKSLEYLESIAIADYQRKETLFDETELKLVREYYKKIYYLTRTVNQAETEYRTSAIFDYVKNYMNTSIELIKKNITDNKNRRVAFIFVSDTMMITMIKAMKVSGIDLIHPASVLTFNAKIITENNKLKNIMVNGTYNDEPIIQVENYKKFTEDISKLIKDYKEYCNN